MNAHYSTLGLGAEQRANRRHALGASDMNTIMSGDEKRLLQLWREKRGEAEPEDLSDNLAVQMGVWTEEFNRQWFEKCNGLEIERVNFPPCDKGPSFMRCTLDGWIASKSAVFEAKHVGTRSTDAEVFARYVPQITASCICTGARTAFLSAFKGNGDFVQFEYELDEDYAARVLAAADAFWECVRSGKPPCAVPAEPTPLPVGVKEVDMSTSNSWCSYAGELIETRIAHQRHEDAKKEIKELIEPDVTKAFGAGIEFRRDKRGALRIYFAGEAE